MRVSRSAPFVIGFSLSVMFFVCLNFYLFSTSHELPGGGLCMDCGLPVGFPFTMYRTDYMWGGEGFIASGVFANICVAIISGGIVGFVISRLWQVIVSRTSTASLK